MCPDAAGLWAWMVAENGHVRRLDATLGASEREAVLDELGELTVRLSAPATASLRLPRTMTLVTATA